MSDSTNDPIALSDSEWDEQCDLLIPLFEKEFAEASNDFAPLSNKIVDLAKQYPTSACAQSLAVALNNATHTNPAIADTVIQALQAASPSLHFKVDWAGNPEEFLTVFTFDALDLLNTILFENQSDRPPRVDVAPTNRTFSSALLGALILKYKLFFPVYAPTRFADMALGAPGAQSTTQDREEVYALAVCLQLAVAGAAMSEAHFDQVYESGTVVGCLKGLKEKGVVKYPKGVALLDETIANAEAGFSQVLSAREAWEKLF